MMKRIWLSAGLMLCCFQGNAEAHCQMPCGIYHDDMVFDQIDQYIETVVKGITVLEDNKFSSIQDRNEFMRWVMQKENMSNETANLITTYFLQQKIKPGADDTIKRLESAHKLLFLLVLIKQGSGLGPVNDFYEEWERFKLMFHIEGYECKIEMLKEKKAEMKASELFKELRKGEEPHTH